MRITTALECDWQTATRGFYDTELLFTAKHGAAQMS